MKTVKFGSPKYVGDPINAVRIFNEKEVDELMVLDIDATPWGAGLDFELVEQLDGRVLHAALLRRPHRYV